MNDILNADESMPREHPSENGQTSVWQRGLRFGLIDLMGAVAWAAVPCAFVAPWIGACSPSIQLQLGLAIFIQVAIVLGSIAFCVTKLRATILKRAGAPIGISEGGIDLFQSLRTLALMVFVCFLIVIQAVAVVTAINFDRAGWMFVGFVPFSLTLFRLSFARFRLGHPVDSIEFYQQGIVFRSYRFFPWDRVAIKAWDSFPKQLVVLVYPDDKWDGEKVLSCLVSNSLYDSLNERGRIDYRERA
ncbi:hypothetical protein [Blastopirellula marina]|uniref:Uncharacterized protein n=1 Tax=Blastopirellula marina TaxID=124 RepID=A0A2S8GDZ9_9BACT|nr:hypothetical protein [Blastopirellula marina]PQO42688.1 hypothetical protein C5Y98_00610 [Blastopirellula marina]PTL46454.1 hypothetical protein C5Y97_00610 [Blastopirellula marina]